MSDIKKCQIYLMKTSYYAAKNIYTHVCLYSQIYIGEVQMLKLVIISGFWDHAYLNFLYAFLFISLFLQWALLYYISYKRQKNKLFAFEI